MITLRRLRTDDAPALTDLLIRNRAFMTPWEPTRDDDYFTPRWQEGEVARLVALAGTGVMDPFVILDEDGIAGRITVNNIVRGPLLSASVGYWVDEARGGRGVASAALAALIPIAFGELGLHRLEAGTLTHNVRSQRVLLKNGFVQYGLAPRYLRIDGAWQDHLLYQLLDEA